MKYFIDCEFIEGFHKPLFGKRRHFIDLISIGIVCEDGREYYAISKEFDPTKRGINEKDIPARNAFFFTDSMETAQSYGKNIQERYGIFKKPLKDNRWESKSLPVVATAHTDLPLEGSA